MKAGFLSIASAVLLCLAGCVEAETPDTPSQEQQTKPEPPQPQKTDPNTVVSSVYITTPNRVSVSSKDYWLENAGISIQVPDEELIDYGSMKIKLRGNSSRWFDKKSYNIKLETKASVLGMPASKSWCFLANWMDKTSLRNDVAFEISRRTGLAWTPRGRYVKLYMNDRYDGLYYVVEKIKIAKNRVNISDDGYIVELDSYYDEVNKFHSAYISLPVNFKEPDPDVMTPEKMQAFKDYFNEAERLICSGSKPDPAYLDYIDVDSYVDWLIVQELVENPEPNHPKSTYVYKDVNGKLYAGPTWDHDWYTYVPGINYYTAAYTMWYKYLMNDPTFRATMKRRWNSYKGKLESIPDYIKDRSEMIYSVALENNTKWPIKNHDVNGDEHMSFSNAVTRMTNAYKLRFEWLDKEINKL